MSVRKIGPVVMLTDEMCQDAAEVVAAEIETMGRVPFPQQGRTGAEWLSLLQWQRDNVRSWVFARTLDRIPPGAK